MSTGKKSRTLFPPSLRYWRLPTSKRYTTTRRHCDDAAALQKKAAEAGVRCTLTVKRGVVHAYPVITQLRETRETFAEMQHFFRREGVLCGN